jgi:pSer/pThr/pTyr-binding forkhead associated (FHA) protein
MEPTHDILSADSPVSESGELIVLNGRLAGTRKALNPSVTVIGRGTGCDVRLNVEGVGPLHCLVIHDAEGLRVRELDSHEGTFVNGERVSGSAALGDEDTLTVGPFRFGVRLPPGGLKTATTQFLLRETDQIAKEKEALRIQAAAVVAQQTALTESEAKLEQRRAELQRQEEQLAGYLEEKRAKLAELQNQVREARDTLEKEREEHDGHRKNSLEELERTRQELTEAQQQAEKDKQRLAKLHHSLHQRYHQHWDKEKAELQEREDALAARKRELEKATEQIHHDRAALAQARLRFNGEVELGRRQLQAAWNELQHQRTLWQGQRGREQAEAKASRDELDRRALALADAEQQLADERLRWEDTRYLMEKELAGLNNRTLNQRRKLLDLDQEAQRPGQLESGTSLAPAGTATIDAVAITPATTAGPDPAEGGNAPVDEQGTAMVLAAPGIAAPVTLPEGRLAGLERLADELTEQRLKVADQCQRVLWAHQRWLEEQRNVVRDLEEFGLRLAGQERELQVRAQAVEEAECVVRQHQNSADLLRNHLEGWQTRLSAREIAWEGERERLLIHLQGQEELVRKQLVALADLRKRWGERRKEETKRLQTEHDNCLTYRQQYVALWEDSLRKSAAVEHEQRSLAERSLALEQYRLEVLGTDANSVAVERRLERLQRRWAAFAATAERQLAQERKTLQAEKDRLQEYARTVRDQALVVTRRDEELSLRLAEWEQEREETEAAQNKLRQELQALQAERDHYERHLEAQRQELERLARSLLEDETVLAQTLRAA